jgi:multidrug efflux pump subunit AcrA (membrane-fusion protein)
VLARSFLRVAASSNSPDANAIEARTLAGQLLAKIDTDEQAERQKVIDDRLARERSDLLQEQRRLADLERAQRERIAQANRIAAEKEAARLAKEEEDRQRPLREAAERARVAQADEESRRQCDAVARVCRGRPDVNMQVLEELSRQYRVARREIQIARTFVQKGWFGCSCTGIFETPVGSYECGIQQNSSGVVTSARCAN